MNTNGWMFIRKIHEHPQIWWISMVHPFTTQISGWRINPWIFYPLHRSDSKFLIKILFNHRTPQNSLNSLRDRLTQKMTKYIIKVCGLSVFRWTKNNSELWYIAILQKRSHLKKTVFWFSLVIPIQIFNCFSISIMLLGITEKFLWNSP